MSHVTASIGNLPYAVSISTGNHRLASDEPVVMGGGDHGPTPHDLLLSSLASCTLITLKMYAHHKHWPLLALDVELSFIRDEAAEDAVTVERVIALHGPLSDAARDELADLAERTPVTLRLKPGLPIHTVFRQAAAPAMAEA